MARYRPISTRGLWLRFSVCALSVLLLTSRAEAAKGPGPPRTGEKKSEGARTSKAKEDASRALGEEFFRNKTEGAGGTKPTPAPKPPSPPTGEHPVTVKEGQAAEQLARYIARGSYPLESLLADAEIPPHPWAADPGWPQRSAESKLKMLVEAAERTTKRGGEVLLARLSQALANQFDTVKQDRALKSYLEMNTGENPIRFAEPPARANSVQVKLSRDATKAIASLAVYIERGGHVTVEDLVRVARLPQAEGDRILKQQPTDAKTAIREIIATAAKGSLEQNGVRVTARIIIAGMTRLVARNYETAKSDTALRPYQDTALRPYQSWRPTGSARAGGMGPRLQERLQQRFSKSPLAAPPAPE